MTTEGQRCHTKSSRLGPISGNVSAKFHQDILRASKYVQHFCECRRSSFSCHDVIILFFSVFAGASYHCIFLSFLDIPTHTARVFMKMCRDFSAQLLKLGTTAPDCRQESLSAGPARSVRENSSTHQSDVDGVVRVRLWLDADARFRF